MSCFEDLFLFLLCNDQRNCFSWLYRQVEILFLLSGLMFKSDATTYLKYLSKIEKSALHTFGTVSLGVVS